MARRPITESRNQYDPSSEGYGNERQWKSAFHSRTGSDDEDFKTLQIRNAQKLLEVSGDATYHELKASYRRKAKKLHPDVALQNGLNVEFATAQFKNLQEAYEILKSRLAKNE